MALMQPYKTIPLVNGGHTLVDESDYERVAQHRWFRSENGYVRRQGWTGPQKKGGKHWCVWLHREINQTPDHLFTDHINGNKLDNRRCNLRTATKSDNGANRPKPDALSPASRFKGVVWHKATGLWMAHVTCRSRHFATYHKTPEQAALGYNELAKKFFGNFASINKGLEGVIPTQLRKKTSHYRGVRHWKNKRWIAYMDINGKTTHLGVFETEREAAIFYNEWALKIRGDRAKLNSIDDYD